jgi:serine/threonine protein kinase
LDLSEIIAILTDMVEALSDLDGRVVHRDLKPENLFITKDGQVKILDFGLAKRVRAKTGESLTKTETASDLTKAGAVMGTVGYMSPEQVTGESVDHRSDIFSFGTIVYEMISGRNPFRRATSPDNDGHPE